MSDLLDLDQASEALGVTRYWLAEQCRQDKIPCRKVGRYWKFRRQDIDEYLERVKRGRDPWQRSPQGEAARRRHRATG